jgi:hypothetical protein
MGASHLQVVVLDRDPGKDRLHEGLAARPPGRAGQLDTDKQLGGCDGCYGHVVVPDQPPGRTPALAHRDAGRIEDQPV